MREDERERGGKYREGRILKINKRAGCKKGRRKRNMQTDRSRFYAQRWRGEINLRGGCKGGKGISRMRGRK